MTSSQRSSRIISHGKSQRSRIFSFLSRIRELANYSLHTEYHGGSRFFLVTRLVLGPTDQREVIIELSNFLHTECRGRTRYFSFFHELSNFRINTFNHTESRGRSRIIELSNFLHTENRGRSRFFVTRLVLWTH